MKHIVLFFLAFFFTTLGVFSQSKNTGVIRGFVYEKNSGEPVIFTNVYLDKTSYGSGTDVNGYFSISKIEPGKYTVIVSSVGFEKYTQEINIEPGKLKNIQIFLEETSIELQEFEISAAKKEAKNQVQMSVVKVTPKEIKALPSVGGEADLAQYLQVLPGVVFTGDQGGQLYIRGGSPIQNKVLLDGMVVYNPFHSIGLFSVFDTDVIKNADIYTGGFSALYGGRISSIMDIKTKDGNTNKLEGKINANPFGTKVLLNGPFQKRTEKGNSKTFLLSAKTSYLRETSKKLYSYASDEGLPFNYTDIFGKITFNAKGGSKFNLFGFNFYDQVDYLGVSRLEWLNRGGGANFIMVPSGTPVLVEGYIALSDYGITLDETGINSLRESSIGGFDLGLDFKYFMGENELKYGVQINGYSTNFKFFNAIGQNFDITDNATEVGTFFEYKIKAGSLVIDPSVRLQYYASLSEFVLEPRIGLKYNLNEFIRLKAAGGFYSQNLIAGNSDRDVVNLFYGFISSPENLPETFIDENGNTTDVESALQKAQHAIFGVEYDLTDRINLNIEGYYKRFSQLTNINRNRLYPDTPEYSEKPDEFKKDYVLETGEAKGIDFVLKYTSKNLFVWAVYSYGDVDRWDGFQTYDPIFDRRHNVNLLSTYKFGKNRSWEASVRWNFGSGLPFTKTRGFYENNKFNDGLGTDVTQTNGEFSFLLGNLNKGRMSDYHRMDISLTKTFTFKNSTLEANAGVTNIYNRENIFYIDRITFEQVNQLPILPSFGLTYSF